MIKAPVSPIYKFLGKKFMYEKGKRNAKDIEVMNMVSMDSV